MVNRETQDIFSLATQDTDLRRKASTRGGEYCGPCPFCGGKDRFLVWPEHRGGQWWCRQCNRGGDAITYLVETGRITPGQAGAMRHGKDMHLARQIKGSGKKEKPPTLDDENAGPPPEKWQEAARRIVEDCEKTLWDEAGVKALVWLRGRGLKDDTIRAWRLGYHRADGQMHGLYVCQGIVIPWFAGKELWAINVRRSVGKPKYQAVKGSRKGLFGVDRLAGKTDCIVVEGEFDVILLWQELGDLADVLPLGSAADKLADRWLLALLPFKRFWIATDNDGDGEKCAAYWLNLVGKRGQRVYPPAGEKDVGDAWKAGADLRAWAMTFLAREGWADAGVVLNDVQGNNFPLSLVFPADLQRLVVIAGQWQRLSDGRVQAYFQTRKELEFCHAVMQAIGTRDNG